MRFPLKTLLPYRGCTFRIEHTENDFRVYFTERGLRLVGCGDRDVNTTFPRWIIRPAGQSLAELLIDGRGKEDAIRALCDRWLESLKKRVRVPDEQKAGDQENDP